MPISRGIPAHTVSWKSNAGIAKNPISALVETFKVSNTRNIEIESAMSVSGKRVAEVLAILNDRKQLTEHPVSPTR